MVLLQKLNRIQPSLASARPCALQEETSEGEPARRSLQGHRLVHRRGHGQERAFHLLRVGFKARGGLFAKVVCGGDGSGATERGKRRAVDSHGHAHTFHASQQRRRQEKNEEGLGSYPASSLFGAEGALAHAICCLKGNSHASVAISMGPSVPALQGHA